MRGVAKSEVDSDIQFDGFASMLGSTSVISSIFST